MGLGEAGKWLLRGGGLGRSSGKIEPLWRYVDPAWDSTLLVVVSANHANTRLCDGFDFDLDHLIPYPILTLHVD